MSKQKVSNAILKAFAQIKKLAPTAELVLEDNGVKISFPIQGVDFMDVADMQVLVQGGAQVDADFAPDISEQLDEAGIEFGTYC